ncbi:MAG: undecaprenyldiphospho-muramoylpentapeptide beta-N-acetylglucosaminyltransferase [bacterium]|nr:undecaprenyldiphospho-muramoylpentapeptide beta-N-acetylglucosaminyltransferase [bacterium]
MIIAGGGTGGHLFPAIAVAGELKYINGENDVLFVGTKNGIESRVLPDEGWPVKFITAGALKGRGLFGMIIGLLKAAYGLMESLSLIRRFGPDIILGVGGYVSAPLVLAGRLSGVKTAIHEQNAMPGLTNRILGKIVNKIFITYPESKRFFPSLKVLVTGNPVRREIKDAFQKEEGDKKSGDAFNLLIFGGSRGAASINRAVSEAFTGHAGKMLNKMNIVHQTGLDDFERIRQIYKDSADNPDIRVKAVPFIKDMTSAYRKADLVVCRAGATTIAELVAAGRPSILVPYPFASDDHQRLNAKAMVDAGAAIMMDDGKLDGSRLSEEIATLLEHPEALGAMGKKAKMMRSEDAAKLICKELISLAA